MPTLSKSKRIRVGFAISAGVGIVAVTVYLSYLVLASEPQRLSPPERADKQSVDQMGGEGPSSGEQVSLGRLLGTNNPAVPPVITRVGPRPGETDTPDLSTPAAAVYSVLSLIDQDATNKLAGCFLRETANMAGSLYPRHLGLPVELVDVFEDGESAMVVWNATVRTELSLDGRNWSAGEKMTLTTRLRRVNGLWKLLKLYEGDEDDSQ